MTAEQTPQPEDRKKIRVKTGRRKAKKRVWKTKWVKAGRAATTTTKTRATAKAGK